VHGRAGQLPVRPNSTTSEGTSSDRAMNPPVTIAAAISHRDLPGFAPPAGLNPRPANRRALVEKALAAQVCPYLRRDVHPERFDVEPHLPDRMPTTMPATAGWPGVNSARGLRRSRLPIRRSDWPMP
jgi:hypothetical protein